MHGGPREELGDGPCARSLHLRASWPQAINLQADPGLALSWLPTPASGRKLPPPDVAYFTDIARFPKVTSWAPSQRDIWRAQGSKWFIHWTPNQILVVSQCRESERFLTWRKTSWTNARSSYSAVSGRTGRTAQLQASYTETGAIVIRLSLLGPHLAVLRTHAEALKY